MGYGTARRFLIVLVMARLMGGLHPTDQGFKGISPIPILN